MHWNIPNILTIVRLAAAPLIVVLYLSLPRPVSDWAVLILFTAAALTDYIDGYLARKWDQTSSFGKMMDPIADKAMTILALLLLTLMTSGLGLKIGNRYFDQSLFVLVPTAAIMFREVGVSGLREFLGARASGLPVTRLAKWKTAAQMLAVVVLFSQGLFENYYGVLAFGFTPEMAQDILLGLEEDLVGLRWRYNGFIYSQAIGTGLLWLAGLLTLVTGFDYFRKALPFLKEDD
jgi:CDP-diacylglycerol---glycerol-3-phosphate 3-phosphatidyltransferase